MEKGISIYKCKLINSFSNCSEVNCYGIIIVFIMQIFHPLKTSLFLVLTPALVRCSVVSLSYSWDFLTPRVRNVAQLVLQKKKFKSFIVMTDTCTSLLQGLISSCSSCSGKSLQSSQERMYSNSKEQQKSSMLFTPSHQYNHKHKNARFWYSYAFTYVRPAPLMHSSFYAYACALVRQTVLHTAKWRHKRRSRVSIYD